MTVQTSFSSKITFLNQPFSTVPVEQAQNQTTLISADIRDQCHWEILEDLGSDHLPILISINVERGKPQPPRLTRWNYSKANWNEYRTKSDSLLATIDFKAGIDTQDTHFCHSLLQAANHSIAKGNRAKYKIFWNEELEVAVNNRKKAWKAVYKNKNKKASPEEKTFLNKCSVQHGIRKILQ